MTGTSPARPPREPGTRPDPREPGTRPDPHEPGTNRPAPEPRYPPAMATHRVMRQDDNGNRFVVAKGLDRAEARRLAAELEARGHKQLYWVEPDGPAGPEAADRTVRNA